MEVVMDHILYGLDSSVILSYVYIIQYNFYYNNISKIQPFRHITLFLICILSFMLFIIQYKNQFLIHNLNIKIWPLNIWQMI